MRDEEKETRAMKKNVNVVTVKTDKNGGCGECACLCHTDVEDPGEHIATCKFADPNYCPPDFHAKVAAAIGRPLS